MDKTATILILIALLVGFCGCNKSDSKEQPITKVNEISETFYSTDEVTVNDLCINLLEFDDNEEFTELQINFTSKFDFDCSDIGIEVNLLDENDGIIENTCATLDDVRSGQSGDATVTLNRNTDFTKVKTIEICNYCAWTQSDDDTIEEIEGTFAEKQVFAIEDISVNSTNGQL